MKKINIGIVAHVDAGKTTVTENLLYLAGVIKEIGRVDSGNTQTDSMELERKRGISIKSSPTSFNWNDVKINIIDTPGHVDFISEVQRSLSVLDGAVLVVSAKEGVQSQTRVLFDTLKSLNIPTLIFINKIDRIGVNLKKLIRELKTSLSNKIVRLQNVYDEGNKEVSLSKLYEHSIIDEDIMNVLSELDDDILESYLNDINLCEKTIENKVSFYSKKGSLYPVLFGSALLGIGIKELLDAVPKYLPFSNSNKNNTVSGVVFKIQREGMNEKKIYIRLYEGEICLRDTIKIANKDTLEKIHRINIIENGKLIEASNVSAGDIAVLYNIKSLEINDVLGSECEKFKAVNISKPTLTTRVLPVNKEDKNRLFTTLTLLTEEDPLLEINTDGMENEIHINLFGEIQMEILKSLLLDKYNIEVNFLDTTTIYKETPRDMGSAVFYINKNPFSAGVGIKVEPIGRGKGLEYVTEVSFGSLEKPFQNAVKEAVLQTCKQGLLGWEVTDIKVTFNFSQYDSVCSTPSGFRNLTPMVLMEALDNAKTELLEPYYKFELKVPKSMSGKAISDLEKMRAAFDETNIKGNEFVVKGLIPVDTCKTYSLRLASYTEGKGLFYTKLYGYKKGSLDLNKRRKKTMIDPLNKKLYLMKKLNAIKDN